MTPSEEPPISPDAPPQPCWPLWRIIAYTGMALGALQTPLLCCGVFFTAIGELTQGRGVVAWLVPTALGAAQLIVCNRLLQRSNAARIWLIGLLVATLLLGLWGIFDALALHQIQSWWWSAPGEFVIGIVTYLLYPALGIYGLTRPAIREQFTRTNSTRRPEPVP